MPVLNPAKKRTWPYKVIAKKNRTTSCLETSTGSGFLSAYCGFELVVTTCSNARPNDGAGFAETIDYCWMARASAAALRRRLRLPTKSELRERLKGSPEPTREHNKVGQLWVGGYLRHLRCLLRRL